MNTNEPLPRKKTLDYLEGKAPQEKYGIKKNKKKVLRKKVNNTDRFNKFKKQPTKPKVLTDIPLTQPIKSH